MLRASSSSIPALSQKTMTPTATLVWLDQSVSRRSLDWAGDLKFLGGVRDNTTPTAPPAKYLHGSPYMSENASSRRRELSGGRPGWLRIPAPQASPPPP